MFLGIDIKSTQSNRTQKIPLSYRGVLGDTCQGGHSYKTHDRFYDSCREFSWVVKPIFHEKHTKNSKGSQQKYFCWLPTTFFGIKPEFETIKMLKITTWSRRTIKCTTLDSFDSFLDLNKWFSIILFWLEIHEKTASFVSWKFVSWEFVSWMGFIPTNADPAEKWSTTSLE